MNDIYDPLDLEAQAEEATVKEDRQRQDAMREEDDFKWLMGDERGRRIVWDLLSRTGVFVNPFVGGPGTDFNCGKQLVGQHYFGLVNQHCAEKYSLMVKEQQENDK